MEKLIKRKKDKKPLYILTIFILFFGVFIYLISRPSVQAKALRELDASYNKKDVEMVWYKYKIDLHEDEDFLFAVRNKLASFKLSENDEKDCMTWLPSPPVSLNLIIIPDLSKRITDTLNNPNQVQNDILALQTIWNSFVDYSKLKQNTEDRLIVDVTDADQAGGNFMNVANDLQFDLSTHKGKSNLLFFTNDKTDLYNRSINKMYQMAIDKPLGADYSFYFRRHLNDRLRKNTLFNNYINKVIIITDGYLEAQNRKPDTEIFRHKTSLRQSTLTNNTLDIITKNNLNIPKVNIDLSNTEILICEVNERKSGTGYDFEILKTYWEDWLKRMNASKISFIQREQAYQLTANHLKDFISK